MILKIGEKRIRSEYVMDYEPLDESGFNEAGMAIISYYILITSTLGQSSVIPFLGNKSSRDETVKMMDEIFEPLEHAPYNRS